MTLGTELGETNYNMVTIYPIQSNQCGKGLLMMNTLWASQQDSIRFFKKRTSYVHPQLWVLGDLQKKSQLVKLWYSSSEIPLAIATGHGYLLGGSSF